MTSFLAILSVIIKTLFFAIIFLALNTFVALIIELILTLVSIVRPKPQKNTMSTRAVISKSDFQMLRGMGFHVRPEEIGSGYFGTVYKAYHKPSDDHNLQTMAIKVIDVKNYHQILRHINGHIDGQSLKTCFDKNVDNLEKINNKRIVRNERVLKTFTNDNKIHKLFVFSKTAEISLNEFMSKEKPNGLDSDWAHSWFTDICEAVQCLHNEYKVFHRNIKTENILLYRKTNEIKPKIPFDVKLSDTGIASLFPNSIKVRTKMDPLLVISLSHSASDNAGAKDIYGLGIVLIVLLRGSLNKIIINNRPFAVFANFNDRALDVFDDCPQLKELLEAMLSRCPNSRPDINDVIKHQWIKVNKNG